MRQLQPLLDLYEKWRSLTLTEGSAIAESNWPMVEICQEAKSRLKVELLNCSSQYQRGSGEQPELNPPLRSVLNQLIEMEGQNATLLANKKEEAAQQRTELEKEKRVLGKVRRSYAPVQMKTWFSYS